MALAVLDLSSRSRVTSASRLLDAAEWRGLQQAEGLRGQAEAALEAARAEARDAVTAEMRERADALERHLQTALLKKTMALQAEYERAMQALRECFVQAVITSLEALLAPVPPAFYARVQHSAAALIGETAAVTLHVAASDEAAAQEGLGPLGGTLKIVVDPNLTSGQCFLETRFGRIQAALSVQLETLREALQRWWHEGSNASACVTQAPT